MERDELMQAQSAMAQIMSEFYASVSAADEASSALTTLDVLTLDIESSISSLVSGVSDFDVKRADFEQQVKNLKFVSQCSTCFLRAVNILPCIY